jgi:hypothetical protein
MVPATDNIRTGAYVEAVAVGLVDYSTPSIITVDGPLRTL